MRYFFAFPASAALAEGFNSVLAAFAENMPSQPMAPQVVTLAQRYTDEIVDALVLNLAKGPNASQDAPKALETVANVIKSTAHGLIRQVVAKMDNAELKPLMAYIEHHRQRFESQGQLQDFISFELTAQDYELLSSAWQQTAATGENPKAMEKAMIRFVDLALQAFYTESAQAMKLGFIARNLFAVGEAAIRKGSHLAIGRLVPSLKAKELKAFASYFDSMLKVK